MAELVVTKTARTELEQLPASLRRAVAGMIDRIADQPEEVGVPLLGRLRGRWSARVGTYRIIYSIESAGNRQVVIVRAIRHRAVAYGRRRR